MIRDEERRRHRASRVSAASSRWRRRTAVPAVEALEERQLLSAYTGPSSTRPVVSHGAVFTISVTGGGYETIKRLRHGELAINLFATNPSSTLNISAQARQARFSNTPLKIGQINVKTGLLGAIKAPAADLLGPMTPINDAVSSIEFNGIGPSATVDVAGNLGGLSAGSLELGPTGRVHVGGDLTGPLGGSVLLDGGSLIIDGNATGALQPGTLTVQHGGILAIGHDLEGGIKIAGPLDINTNGLVKVGHDLGGMNIAQGLTLDSGGRLVVGDDITAAGVVGGDLNIANNGLFSVDRDFATGLTVGGDLRLDSGGNFRVGRDLAGLTVGGDVLVAPGGGSISVGGNLENLKVTGAFEGKGSSSSTDLVVGLSLSNLSVLGGGADKGGIQGANIDVGKSILGLDVSHGIFNSFITAGVSIDGNGQGGSSGNSNVGADGVDAVFDSEIRAGLDIFNLKLGGDVRSDWVTNPNPTGYRTRIIAGETRRGTFTSGGVIDNFQITGALIDSVVAASVAPSGGNGTLPSTGYGPPPVPNGNPAQGTYDAPAGVTVGGSVSTPVAYDNWTELSYYNETLTKVSYNTAIDPNIDDFILPGTINPSFASPPLTQAELANSTATTTTTTGSSFNQTQITVPTSVTLPLPTTSTVLGGVISTQHGDDNDFAGLFAADTSGVFIGTLPK